MSSDLDAQNDEMLALESIFDSDEFSYKKDNGEYCGQFYAFVSLPGEIRIEYQLLPFKNRFTTVEAGELNHISVKYLPAIELSFTLPPDYPSTSPPRFTLICSWLGRNQLSKLCEKLDSLWNENKGLEILYLWLSFLKEESFTFLELGTTLNLSKQYSFNMVQLERKKKLQSEANNPTLSTTASSPDALSTQGASSSSSNAGTSTNPSLSFSAGMNWTPYEKTAGVSPSRSRGRGRGKMRCQDKTCRPGLPGPPSSVSAETSPGEVQPPMHTSVPAAPAAAAVPAVPTVPVEQSVSNGANVKVKEPCPVSERRKKPFGFKRSPTADYKQKFDLRAVSCETLQTSLISHILEYNRTQSEKEFQRNIYTCQICFDDKPGSQCMEFMGCGHIFCRECVSTFFEVTIKDGNVHGLICPEKGCKSEALQSQISELVSPELFARYDELLLNSALDEMEDIVYCPRKTCQYPVTYEREEQMARCAHCSYTFCTLCRMTYHGVERCRFKNSSGLIAEYEAASTERKRFLEKKYGSKTIREMIETSYSEQWIRGNSKACPHCSAAIEKSDGCNKMICWKCNTFFCWICQTRLNPSNPYNHFNSPTSGCFQMLFHGVDDDSDNDDSEDDEFEVVVEYEDGGMDALLYFV
ncbi:E3 ubiquitin-protein ligase RNF14-like [Thrips palmi]|uniref:RBR-type E3 ubiquitin transferase n=1 Tax=Thrips palmi TaxID=161013 RepID=A0A6P8YX40_THRPL|nr:E3 ubiquitin-protein ligase RNF14-like [Thrips palmi]